VSKKGKRSGLKRLKVRAIRKLRCYLRETHMLLCMQVNVNPYKLLRSCLVLIAWWTLAFTASYAQSHEPGDGGEPPPQRPNFLLIIADDQRLDGVGAFMPRTQQRLFDEGVSFERAYITTSSCAPSRASMLTGLYARNHGVQVNSDRFAKQSISELLQADGYSTALVGKYMNVSTGAPVPGYDFWVSFAGGSGPFINPALFVGAERAVRPGYITHLLRDYALQFLEQAAGEKKPFFLVFAPTAPHNPATPDAEAAQLYKGLAKHRPRSFNESDIKDKPTWMQQVKSLTSLRMAQIDNFRMRQLRTLWPLDRSVDDLLTKLEDLDVLDNTVVLYISDNGMMWGEHRLMSKNVVYEESTRVPFAVRYPKFIKGAVRPEVVANIDIAPTILELAGVQSPWKIDGRSLVPLLTGEATEWRPGVVLEGWLKRDLREPFTAFHSGRFVYVENESGDKEIYDLQIDPGQLTNLAGRSRTYLEIEKQMAKHLREAGVAPVGTSIKGGGKRKKRSA
jgi:N-acetylglucosamine-6-sulfatase